MVKKYVKKLSSSNQIKNMVKKYGTECQQVNIQLHLTYDEMLNFFGEQCEEYEPLCGNCSAWLMWNKTGKAEIFLEREKIVKFLNSNKAY